ncbi:MAG: hypothetical protein K0R65_1254 [Crocinitomicaceae bacterium]|jgi:hypothetical protein|nr:hypothetical protein [Crocinitomicaceae bacterium]
MRLITCFLIILFPLSGWAQKQKPQNYRKFDEKLIHFGFLLGGNTADFLTRPTLNAYEKYGITSLENASQPGGQLGIVTTMKLGTPILRLRFLPSLSFQERVLRYYYLPSNPEKTTDDVNEERVNSTNLDFPLMLQFRTLRYNNFASYVLGGIQYTYDLQSTEKSNQSFTDPFVKIKAEDWQGQVGVGVEFFAVYFKMGLEIKYSQGFQNAVIHDLTPVSNPIDQLRNKVWSFSIIFEG